MELNKISDEDINKALAEFMGLKVTESDKGGAWYVENGYFGKVNYTDSLDDSIPAVKKMYKLSGSREMLEIFTFNIFKAFRDNKSPSRALALACYEVIKNEA